MTIHSTHPFAEPDSERDPLRRVRGRVGGAVTLWTAGEGVERAGLTVSSYLLALGAPGRVAGLVHPDSELLDAAHATGRAVVHFLQWRDRGLAEVFAGLMPAPGGPFAQGDWEQTEWGPRRRGVSTWLGVRFTGQAGDESGLGESGFGWSELVTGVVEHVEVGPDDDPLVHRRGRYVRL